ncbi:MAG: hypoxanthine phosphoribosyltransferase [Chitinophagaceae bacterium]|nr:MAG: hypoxanthine phosphoribosyltransferase [Chitinophagaceae bacterium]
MEQVKVKDKTFRPFIDKDKLQQRIAALSAAISKDYEGLNPLFIGILNGSFIFAADLFRNISIDAEISFIKLASYQGTTSTGTVVTAIGLDETLNGRHVIIVEDIVDTGKTMSAFLPELMDRRPASVKIAALLIKPEALQHDVKVDYYGFEISNEFVVGYGLDYDGYGRNLPELYQVAE